MHYIKAVATALLALFLLACAREKADEGRELPGMRVPVGIGIEDLDGVDTKSVLTSGEIETRISCVSLAAYVNGQLLETQHFSSGFDQMALDLHAAREARVYALANMGDMSVFFPAQEHALPELTYRIPAYTGPGNSIDSQGIPMAGAFSYRDGGDCLIPVRRLLAKLAVDLHVGWSGEIGSVKIRNLNAVLRPFGDSKATSSADLLAEEELATGSGSADGHFVFYIPENLQETVPGITDSAQKEAGNTALKGKTDGLSYLEVGVTGKGAFSGTMTYRSYLGGNAASDFSIRRNCRYTWVLRYGPDGTVLSDWKHENHLSWSRWRYQLRCINNDAFVGETLWVVAEKMEDRYTGGALVKSNASLQLMPPEQVQWTEEEFSPRNFVRYLGVEDTYYQAYQAVKSGSGYIRGRFTDDWGEYEDRVEISVYGQEPTLQLSANPTSIPLGASTRFTALLCHEYGTTPVTHLAGWEKSTGDDWARMQYDGPDEEGIYTPRKSGTETLRAYYMIGDRWLFSNPVDLLCYENSVSYSLSLEADGPDSVTLGEEIHLKAWLNRLVNGQLKHREEVTDQALWSIMDDSGGAWVDAGVVQAGEAGSYTVQARYEAPDGSEPRASCDVHFTAPPVQVTHQLELDTEPEGGRGVAGTELGLKAYFHTLNDGVRTLRSEVSASTQFTKKAGGSAAITVQGKTVSASAAGSCTIIGRYRYEGTNYEAEMEVSFSEAPQPDPLLLSWTDGTPAYVGQRGRLTASRDVSYSLLSGESLVDVESDGARGLYVGLRRPGSVVIQAYSASTGQSAQITLTIQAPILFLGSDRDALPADGAPVTIRTGYRDGQGRTLQVTGNAIACGTSLYKALYDELLEPILQLSGHSFLALDSGTVYVDRLTNDLRVTYGEEDGIGSVTASARKAESGVSAVLLAFRAIDPFPGYPAEATQCPDVHDWTLLERYRKLESGTACSSNVPSVAADPSWSGLSVRIDGTEAGSAFKGRLGGDAGSAVTWSTQLERNDGLHPAGWVQLGGYVENRHSHQRLYKDTACFGLFVHGAIGAWTQMHDFNNALPPRAKYLFVHCEYAGDYSGSVFQDIRDAAFLGTQYQANERLNNAGSFLIVSGPMSATGMGSYLYSLQDSAGDRIFENGHEVKTLHKPRFSILDKSASLEAGNYKTYGGVIFFQPTGGYTHSVGGLGGYGYYLLHVLEDIQNLYPESTWKAGWLVD